MHEPPIPNDEARRIAALRSMHVLYTPAAERFDRITRLAARLFDAPIALVSLVAETSQWFKSAVGLDASGTAREISFCAHAILGDDVLVVEDATTDRRFEDNPLVLGHPSIRFYAGQPLRAADGSRVGTLCVIDRKPRRFTREQLEVLRDLAALAEAELQREELNAMQRAMFRDLTELQLKASTDSLTGLWNRGAVMDLLGAEVARAVRGTPACVAMVDADNFKVVNDQHGHPAGDAVLMELARRIRRAVRGFDMVGRYGGEEFLVVLSNCTVDDGRRVCERIRAFAAEAPVDLPGARVGMSVSIGLAAFDPNCSQAYQLVAAADAALYRAKHGGRNRVEVYAPDRAGVSMQEPAPGRHG